MRIDSQRWFRCVQPSRNIAIVDENSSRAAILADGLRDAGFHNFVHITDIENLGICIQAIDPDVILIDLETPSHNRLEHVLQFSRTVKRPIAIFVDDSDPASVQASVDAGVSAFVVGDIKKDRIRHVVNVCVSRFNHLSRLQIELDCAKAALEERKVIDRAKRLLMAAKGLTEEQAYVLMRKTAMNQNKKISDIAQTVITASDLLK